MQYVISLHHRLLPAVHVAVEPVESFLGVEGSIVSFATPLKWLHFNHLSPRLRESLRRSRTILKDCEIKDLHPMKGAGHGGCVEFPRILQESKGETRVEESR